jgi:hypothetical protein
MRDNLVVTSGVGLPETVFSKNVEKWYIHQGIGMRLGRMDCQHEVRNTDPDFKSREMISF